MKQYLHRFSTIPWLVRYDYRQGGIIDLLLDLFKVICSKKMKHNQLQEQELSIWQKNRTIKFVFQIMYDI